MTISNLTISSLANKMHTTILQKTEKPHIEISAPEVLSKKPLASVMMITYNHEPYIAQAVEGVLKQETKFPIELVIGEDCSCDHTREIVLDLQKKHSDIIRLIISDQNVGALNNLLRTEKALRGKYVAYCEGDDYWIHPLKLQMQVDYLEMHPECGLVHGNFNRLHQEDKFIEYGVNKTCGASCPWDVENPFNIILSGKLYVVTCTACIRKSLLDEFMEKEKYIAENPQILQGDAPRWLYISHKNKIHYFNEILATYRILPESASHSRSKEKSLAFHESSLKVRMYFAEKYGASKEIRNMLEIKYLTVLIYAAYRRNDRKGAKNAYQKLKTFNYTLSTQQWFFYFAAQSKIFKNIMFPFICIRRKYIIIMKKLQNRSIVL